MRNLTQDLWPDFFDEPCHCVAVRSMPKPPDEKQAAAPVDPRGISGFHRENIGKRLDNCTWDKFQYSRLLLVAYRSCDIRGSNSRHLDCPDLIGFEQQAGIMFECSLTCDSLGMKIDHIVDDCRSRAAAAYTWNQDMGNVGTR